MEQKIIPNLWFDDQAEEAAEFYTSPAFTRQGSMCTASLRSRSPP